jgi:hypothetical protein
MMLVMPICHNEILHLVVERPGMYLLADRSGIEPRKSARWET